MMMMLSGTGVARQVYLGHVPECPSLFFELAYQPTYPAIDMCQASADAIKNG